MNQLRDWQSKKEIADRSRPLGIEYFEEDPETSFMTAISDEGFLCINQQGKCITISYAGGATLREWLNRIYANGA